MTFLNTIFIPEPENYQIVAGTVTKAIS